MLNTFPDLLIFSFFAPTILRVAAACAFAYLGYLHYRDRQALGARVGSRGEGLLLLITILYAVIAVGLFLGYYTQIAALAGVAVAGLHLLLRRRFPMHEDIAKSTYYFLIVICLSLLVSGAGAFAYDLPL